MPPEGFTDAAWLQEEPRATAGGAAAIGTRFLPPGRPGGGGDDASVQKWMPSARHGRSRATAKGAAVVSTVSHAPKSPGRGNAGKRGRVQKRDDAKRGRAGRRGRGKSRARDEARHAPSSSPALRHATWSAPRLVSLRSTGVESGEESVALAENEENRSLAHRRSPLNGEVASRRGAACLCCCCWWCVHSGEVFTRQHLHVPPRELTDRTILELGTGRRQARPDLTRPRGTAWSA